MTWYHQSADAAYFDAFKDSDQSRVTQRGETCLLALPGLMDVLCSQHTGHNLVQKFYTIQHRSP
jgi:hypothetical protein